MVPWLAHGLALGLHAHEPHGSYAFGAHFRALKRGLGPETRALGPSVWLHGRLGPDAREVLVAPTRAGGYAFVRVLARVDPSLHLGLSFAPRGGGREGGGLGLPGFDAAFEASAYDPGRAGAALAAAAPLAELFVSAAPWGVRGWDSAVEVPLAGDPSPEAFGRAVEIALDLAARLSRVRGQGAALPPTAPELAQVAAWQAVGGRLGLALDDARMVLRGTVRGARVVVALETEASAVHTAVEARFAQPLGVGLRVDRASSARPYLGRIVKTGDRSFDDAFRSTGWPPTHVFPIVGRADVRAAIRLAAALAPDFALHDHGVVARVPGPLAAAEALERAVVALVTVPTLVHGGVGAADPGPYR